MSLPTLYYVPNASSLAAHVALEWVGDSYDAVATSFGDDILFKLNPIGTAGILDYGDGFVLSQVPAILSYLAQTHPQTGIGDDGDARMAAEIDRWNSFLVSDVHHAFHLLFNPTRYGIEDNEQARNAALALCYRNFSVLNDHLADRQYMMGDRKTIVDAYLLPMIRWSYIQFPEDKRNYQHVNDHHDRLLQDAGVIAAMEDEGIRNSITRH